jgi:hypothetical protein
MARKRRSSADVWPLALAGVLLIVGIVSAVTVAAVQALTSDDEHRLLVFLGLLDQLFALLVWAAVLGLCFALLVAGLLWFRTRKKTATRMPKASVGLRARDRRMAAAGAH